MDRAGNARFHSLMSWGQTLFRWHLQSQKEHLKKTQTFDSYIGIVRCPRLR